MGGDAGDLGEAVNTKEFEYTPLISPDGKWLFFSRCWGEIYYTGRAVVDLAVKGRKQATATNRYRAMAGVWLIGQLSDTNVRGPET
jgi:hypothetical protein